MKIPIFVSVPTALNSEQLDCKQLILDELESLQLEPRTLGLNDFPADLPLREIYGIAKHCAGGVILGFSQFESDHGVFKKGTSLERSVKGRIASPTPWNHIEAGILFGLNLPILVFREPDINGGIFDPGVTDVFVHLMPAPPLSPHNQDALRQVFLKWAAKVREFYYD